MNILYSTQINPIITNMHKNNPDIKSIGIASKAIPKVKAITPKANNIQNIIDPIMIKLFYYCGPCRT